MDGTVDASGDVDTSAWKGNRRESAKNIKKRNAALLTASTSPGSADALEREQGEANSAVHGV
jgi:hypothetical protein